MSDQEKVVNETEKEEIEQEIPESTDVAEEITEPQSDSEVVFEIAENKSLKDKIKNIFSKKYIRIIAIILAVAIVAGTIGAIISHNSCSRDIRDCEIKLDGTVYRLPTTLNSFTKKGWFFEDGKQKEYELVESKDYETYDLKNDKEESIVVLLYNPANIDLEARDCLLVVVGYQYSPSSEKGTKPGFYKLSKGIKLGESTYNDVLNAYGMSDNSSDETYNSYGSFYSSGSSSSALERFAGNASIRNVTKKIIYNEKESDSGVLIGFDKDGFANLALVYRTSQDKEIEILNKFSSYSKTRI